MIADVPPNGWLLYSPTIGEHVIVSPDLESLATATALIVERSRAKYPDAPIHCWELGRRMEISLRSTIIRLEPIMQEPGVQEPHTQHCQARRGADSAQCCLPADHAGPHM